MRNLLIGLLAVLVVLLGVVIYRNASRSEQKDSVSKSETALPLNSNGAEKQATEAAYIPSTGKAEPKPASENGTRADSQLHADPRVKAAEQALASGEKEKAIRSLALVLDEFSTKQNPWATAAADLELLRAKHAAAVRDLLFNPAGDWKSSKYKVVAGDSLERIRKKVVEANHKPVTVGMIRKANRMEKDTIHPGDTLRIPQEEMRVIVDRASYTMRVYFGDLLVGFYKVGLGTPDTPTPVGTFVVGEKQKNPSWFPKGEKPVPYGDPKNPLGTRWLALKLNGNASGYGIHGTNKDEAVGASITQGCVRMYNKDVEELSEILHEGAVVEIR